MINYNLPILLTLALSPAIIHAATLNVDTNDVSCDDLVGTPYCTIDAAVTDSANGDIIEIAAGTYNENITVSTDITINGEDRETTIIDAGGAATQTRALLISGDVSVSNLTIQNGFVPELTLGGGIAGIGNSNIVITDCIIKDNKAGTGGGIFSSGNSITINRSRITNNEAYRITSGSGTSGAVSINTTTPAVIIDSTIDNNTALRGGMTQSISNLIIINSTISGNYASNPPTGVNGGQGGGAIINGSGSSGIVSIYNSTITGNSAASFYGGILNFKGTVTLYNTILAGNTDNGTAPDCSSTITSGGNNIIGTTQGCTLVNSTDDLTNLTTDEVGLSALGDFETFAPPFKLTNPMHALFSSSLAIDAGNPNGCLDNVGGAILTDQRGETRPFDGDGDADARCDIGAFEKVKNIIVTSPDNFTTDETGRPAPLLMSISF